MSDKPHVSNNILRLTTSPGPQLRFLRRYASLCGESLKEKKNSKTYWAFIGMAVCKHKGEVKENNNK